MIEITWEGALTLYLLFALGAVFLIWGWGHLKKRKVKILIEKSEGSTCEFCGAVFLKTKGERLIKCPECGLFNRDSR